MSGSSGVGWDESAVAELLGRARVLRWRTGAVLFRAGDRSDHVLLIRSGQVKVWSTSARGAEAVLAIRGPGAVIGEFSAVDGGVRSATVTALGPLRAAVVPGAEFRRFLHEHPAVMFDLLSRTVARAREADRRRVEFGSSDVAERLARLLLELVDEHGVPEGEGASTIAVPLSQAELAAATSASREAVARALRALRECGALRTQRKRITVLRRDLLANRAAEG